MPSPSLSAVQIAIGSELGDGPTAQALRILAGLLDNALSTTSQAIVQAVAATNIANLAAMPVAQDGVTLGEGQTVLLVNQTVAAQNGPYTVGAVTGGNAPLTRPDWWQTGNSLPGGFVFEVLAAGTKYGGTSWKAMLSGTIGTDDPNLYPKTVKGSVILTNGTVTLGQGGGGAADGLFLYDIGATNHRSTVALSRALANTTTLTVQYAAPTAGRIAGKPGTSAIVIEAEIAAGTINVADQSTLDYAITNW